MCRPYGIQYLCWQVCHSDVVVPFKAVNSFVSYIVRTIRLRLVFFVIFYCRYLLPYLLRSLPYSNFKYRYSTIIGNQSSAESSESEEVRTFLRRLHRLIWLVHDCTCFYILRKHIPYVQLHVAVYVYPVLHNGI
jgi:hypothetical protein